MLALRQLSTGYGGRAVVHEIDIEVAPGKVVALVGANGAGKSTLLKAISGLLSSLAGQITLDGIPIERRTPRERVLAGIMHVPEGRQVFAGLTIGENLRLGAYAHRRRIGDAGISQRIAQVCERFPILLERIGQPAGTLSGGQQQMLAIARGLMGQPRLLLLDEPSLGLSPLLVVEIFRMIERLRSEGIAILLSEQNARMSLAIADHAYVIETGRVVVEGDGKELLGRSEVVEGYLGVGKAIGTADNQRHDLLVSRLRENLRR